MPYPSKPRSTLYKIHRHNRILAFPLRYVKLTSLLTILITFPLFAIVILSILHSNTPTLRDAPTQVSDHTKLYHQISKPNHTTSSITIPQYLQHQSELSRIPNPDKGISLLAACMNRRESLQFSLPSWLSIPQITHIILVDWSSTPPLTPIQEKHLSVIRVENAETWILSRAYNLASKFATSQYILKVDCDTHLEPTFLNNHPLPPKGKYYTAYTSDNTASHALRGVWFARTHDFHQIAGYDERIVEYGYEDTDLYQRFNTFLQPIPLDLESVRHHTAYHSSSKHSTSSHKVSTLMNAAFLQNTTSWGRTLATMASTYTFAYAEFENVLYANITYSPPAVHESTSFETVKSVKLHMLEETLHEHGLPRVLVQGLNLADQEFLAAYLEADANPHVIVALLESNTLGNIFNLVSALQIGITTGRPVIAIWQGSHTTNLNSLIDVHGTNGRLREVVQTASARLHGFSRASRIIIGEQWGCIDASCKKDTAYEGFVKVGEKSVYDERNPLPISVKHHALVKLNGTKTGGEEIRKIAYGCITWSQRVTVALRSFNGEVGFIAERDVTRLIDGVEPPKHGSVGIVGRQAEVVRRLLGSEMCDGCDGDSVLGEVANVLAVITTQRVLPDVSFRGADWIPTTYSIVADLRSLHRAVLGSVE